MSNRFLALGLVTLFSIALAASAAVADPKTDVPVEQAKKWLQLVDEGKYDSSWKEAAPYFQKAVPAKTWSKQLTAVRKPLGKVLSRKLLSAKATKQLPGAPDGDYVVIQFQTSFSQKKSSVETITPMKTKDGRWRIAGYFIK